MSLIDFPPITKLVDEGIQEEVRVETSQWNNRIGLDRYPLSPSQIGKCSLKLARDVAHYHGVANYPREYRTSRLHRIFKRGNTLEESLVDDIEKWTPFKVKLRQQRVKLFDVTAYNGKTISIEGDIDGVVEYNGYRVLVDFKSKGAFYSAGFGDSIAEFFAKLVQTGFVTGVGNDCYIVNDIVGLYNVLPKDDFFVDYILQLNSYAFSDWFRDNPVDGVALYYENKNTCANYEIRWIPMKSLFELAKDKFQRIFAETLHHGPETVAKDFNLGSSRCKLCEYNRLCWDKDPAFGDWKPDRKEGDGSKVLESYKSYLNGIFQQKTAKEAEETIIMHMEREGLTHIVMDDGLTYEKKFLKSPRPHYELRLVK